MMKKKENPGVLAKTSPKLKLKHTWQKIQGGSIEYDLTPYYRILEKINDSSCTQLSDKDLKKRGLDLSRRLRSTAATAPTAATALTAAENKPAITAELLVESFALVRETACRVLGMRPFDVQVIAGLVLHQGKLAQMETGEGKTLAAVFPAFFNALAGNGVHVLTANDYLAQRDAGWMGPAYRFLGLEAAFIREGMSPAARRQAYAADITYLTAKEAGFDFLRDRLCTSLSDLVQRPYHFAIVDEADFIMIDEARVPLVIAAEAPEPGTDPRRMAGIVRSLAAGIDYETDENLRNVGLTDKGIDTVEALLGCGSLHDPANQLLFSSLNVALHAEVLLHRDKDYIVRDGKIELIDEFTGRVAEKRRWPHGIQPAVEAKEGLAIQPEGQLYGSITLQHFLRLYPKLAGMTATAEQAAGEFKTFYDLDVVVIPPHKPCIRVDHADIVFTHREAKHQALVAEIAAVHAAGRPILVGTASVAESETLAGLLAAAGVPCQVLNAKNNDLEAKIIAEAGAYKAVTISTNMAGRGTDIRLGGTNEEDKQRITHLGGLYVIGTNRHESRRIDNQLRGRAGRQGDPGSSRFFISLDDDLMERYQLDKLLPRAYLSRRDNRPIEDPLVGREIARAQRIIEGQNFEIRRTLYNYSLSLENRRRMLQQLRMDILSGTEAAHLLEEKAAQRWQELCRSKGRAVLENVENLITLYHIDRTWSRYLAEAADIREGIHLQVLGGRSPWLEFQSETERVFTAALESMEQDILETFKRVEISEAGIDIDKEGLRGPSSTWTYLINDNPFSNLGLALIAGRNIGLSAGAGLLAAIYLPVTVAFMTWKGLKKYFKKPASPG